MDSGPRPPSPPSRPTTLQFPSSLFWCSTDRCLYATVLTVLFLSAGVGPISALVAENEAFSSQKERRTVGSRQASPHSARGTERAAFDTLRGVSRLVVKHTNEMRRKRGLPRLAVEPILADVGCVHSADMFRRDFFQHESPEGRTPQDRVSQIHRRLVGGVSENLYEQAGVSTDASPLSRRIVDWWMESSPHRKNILSPHASHVGVCTLQRRDTIRATQVFANVVAYVQPEIPHRVRPGTSQPISFHPPGKKQVSVAKYDFWDPTAERAITTPSLLGDSLRFPDTTGTVRTRFYVVEDGSYALYQGPEVNITSSP